MRACIVSSGIWRIRNLIEGMTGFEPVCGRRYASEENFDLVLGWGRRPTSNAAQTLSQKTNKPFVSIEDGFLRSIYPGRNEPPISLVIDWAGVHYDATCASEFERCVETAAALNTPETSARARAAMHLLRELALSKYNHAPRMSERKMGLPSRPSGGRVLVVDQTVGDGAIGYGMANTQTFVDMLKTAKLENPGAQIIVKTHPEVVSGQKRGYLSGALGPDILVVDYAVNPWSLIDAVDKVYVVSSLLGFEALLAGLPVSCFGAPFYAGWGLTQDRIELPRRIARPSVEQLFAAAYFDYGRYADPIACEAIAFEDAALKLAKSRDASLGDWRKRGRQMMTGGVNQAFTLPPPALSLA